MKRLCYIFFFVVLPFAIQAQHFIGPTLSGNFVQTVDNISLTSTQLSGGGEIGVAYQYQREHLLLATSLNYSLQCPVLSLDSQWLAQNMQDTRAGCLSRTADRPNRQTIHLAIYDSVNGWWRLERYVLPRRSQIMCYFGCFYQTNSRPQNCRRLQWTVL